LVSATARIASASARVGVPAASQWWTRSAAALPGAGEHANSFNLDGYPAFQQYFRDRKPPVLIVWGKNDEIFGPAGAEAYLKDLPDAELNLLDTGHFALEEDGDLIAQKIRTFLGRHVR
jgi:pimeloyl-ACP methyl ester carboxylesterase